MAKNNKDDISQISRTAMIFLINHIFTDKHQTITSTMSNQWDDYKSAGWLQNSGWLQNCGIITTLSIDVECVMTNKLWLAHKFQTIQWKVILYYHRDLEFFCKAIFPSDYELVRNLSISIISLTNYWDVLLMVIKTTKWNSV